MHTHYVWKRKRAHVHSPIPCNPSAPSPYFQRDRRKTREFTAIGNTGKSGGYVIRALRAFHCMYLEHACECSRVLGTSNIEKKIDIGGDRAFGNSCLLVTTTLMSLVSRWGVARIWKSKSKFKIKSNQKRSYHFIHSIDRETCLLFFLSSFSFHCPRGHFSRPIRSLTPSSPSFLG